MSDLRKTALDHAVTIATLVRDGPIEPATVVVSAEAFLAFLLGTEPAGDTTLNKPDTERDPVPPPLPSNHDLGRAEQGPFYDPIDDVKTRLVKHEGVTE